jgi:glycosyltransferase involved in cell wall biosynthesis
LEQFGLGRGKYILCVARFVPEKGLDRLIEAFVRSQGHKDTMSPLDCARGKQVTGDGWKLVIVGEADHEDRYSKGLKVKVEDEVKKGAPIVLAGFLSGEPLKELYSNAGLFVLPSLYEGLPIVLLEAMSFGLNIIASDIPQNREVGLRGERYFNPHNPEDIAKKIREFIEKGID